MNITIENMKQRRTIRKYTATQIDEEKLLVVIDAGLHAPSAGGRQDPILVVSQNKEINSELGRISVEVETLGAVRMGRVSTEQPSIIDDATIKNGFYHAPTVITVFAPKNNYNATGDCFAVAQNIVVAAHSLGIGSCIVGRACQTFATPKGEEIQAMWGISNEYQARVHIALGYLDGNAPTYKKRKENRIIRV